MTILVVQIHFLGSSGATAVFIMIHQRYFSPYQHPHMLLQSQLITHLKEIKSVNSGGVRVQTTPRIVILTRCGGMHSTTKLRPNYSMRFFTHILTYPCVLDTNMSTSIECSSEPAEDGDTFFLALSLLLLFWVTCFTVKFPIFAR